MDYWFRAAWVGIWRGYLSLSWGLPCENHGFTRIEEEEVVYDRLRDEVSSYGL
jgi:hypothetical protein